MDALTKMVEAVRTQIQRIQAEKQALADERDEVIRELNLMQKGFDARLRKLEDYENLIGNIRSLIGYDNEELLTAVRRVVRDRDEAVLRAARSHTPLGLVDITREAQRVCIEILREKLDVNNSPDLREILREILGAKSDERTADAAKRVVKERDLRSEVIREAEKILGIYGDETGLVDAARRIRQVVDDLRRL